MADVRGELQLSVGPRSYRLHLGFIALANLQAKHGQDVFARLEPPAGAAKNWVPPLAVVVDMVREALDRHHASDLEEDRYLVDDLLAANPNAFPLIMAAAFPDAQKAETAGDTPGNRKRPKAAA